MAGILTAITLSCRKFVVPGDRFSVDDTILSLQAMSVGLHGPTDHMICTSAMTAGTGLCLENGLPGIGDDRGNTADLTGSWRSNHFLETGFHSPMKETCRLDDNRFLRHDGADLAALPYLLKLKHERSCRDIRNAVQLVAPFFEDFLLEPLRLGPDTIRLLWKHKSSDEHFDAFSCRAVRCDSLRSPPCC